MIPAVIDLSILDIEPIFGTMIKNTWEGMRRRTTGAESLS